MRQIALIISLFSLGAVFPKPTGYVNDFAGIIDLNTKNTIQTLSAELNQKSGAQLSVVTVKNLDELSIEDYAWKLFENWGIGEKGKDTGVLLLIAPNQKKMRIEVGYGFEGAIPDGLAGEIIRQDIIPYFKKGDMNQGILRGSLILLDLMAKEMNVSLSGNYQIPQRVERKASPLRLIFNILFIFLILGGRWFFFPLFFMGRRGYYSSGGGGFGGFSGFGGGLSGGGGAGGSW